MLSLSFSFFLFEGSRFTMKSIKPGRSHSMMGVVMSIAMGLFGILWTSVAFSMGAGPFALFGVIFIGIAAAQGVLHYKNATGKNRYSSFDIVDGTEEPDPLNERFGQEFPADLLSDTDILPCNDAADRSADAKNRFCPYCGAAAKEDFVFCSKCGRRLP